MLREGRWDFLILLGDTAKAMIACYARGHRRQQAGSSGEPLSRDARTRGQGPGRWSRPTFRSRRNGHQPSAGTAARRRKLAPHIVLGVNDRDSPLAFYPFTNNRRLAQRPRSLEDRTSRRLRPHCPGSDAASALQVAVMQLLRSGAELTQLVDGCAGRRERERLERFSEHLVKVITRRNARGHVRAEMFAG